MTGNIYYEDVYIMIEEKVTIGTKYPLNGLLTIPQNSTYSKASGNDNDVSGTESYPAVVLVHGSGAHDMNEKIGRTFTFRDLAEGLVKRGIAAIRYNKRTFSYGKEMVKYYGNDLTVKEETIEDAVIAADLLRKDPRINSEKIFIIGHSMGGMLAPRIDAEGGNFAGLIIFAGSPRKIEEIIMEQQETYLKDANAFIKWIANKQFGKIKKKLDRIYDMTDEEAKTTAFIGKYNKMYYLKEWGSKPSPEYLKDLQKPVLVMHGTADFHVSVENDFNKYKEILADHQNADFKLYPDLNHLFMPKVYGDIKKALKEYKKAQKVEEYVIDDIANWINNFSLR